jgi:hypothetical protein
MMEENKNDLAESVEKMFEGVGQSEEMWSVAGKYALQLEQGQIYILTLIKFLARKANQKTKEQLMGFYEDYTEMQNHRNTAMFIARLAEFDSLKRFIGSGLNVQVEKK